MQPEPPGSPEPAAQVGAPRNPALWTLAGTVIGIGLLYASTRQVDAAALVDLLRLTDWRWALAVFVATLTFCAIKAWRWGLLLNFTPATHFGGLHGAVYAGLAVNFLVAHAGELLRAAIVAREGQVAISAVFASVVIERVLDFIALLVLLVLIVLLVPETSSVIETAAAISGAFSILAIGGLLALMYPPEWSMRLAARLARGFSERLCLRIVGILERFKRGLSPLRSPKLMLRAILASVVQWGLVALAIGSSSLAVGEPASLIATTVTLVLIVLGLTLPNSPLQIGTTQLAFVVGLGTGGTSGTAAIAASLVYTAFLIIPIMLGGGIVLLRGKIGLRQVRQVRWPRHD